MNTSILITGGAGFIGTHLCRNLIIRGHDVMSLDLKDPKSAVAGVRYLKGDARNFETVSQIVSKEDIHIIYHLAATVSVPLCQNDPVESYSHNLTATQSVLEAAKKSSHPVRVAFASSAALYGDLGNSRTPLNEGKIAESFSSFYAAQKHASEKMIELYHEYCGVPALIFRFFNVYGIGQDPTSPYSGVITIFSRMAREKKPILLNNAGVQTRDFIAVTELTHAIAEAAELPAEDWNGSVMNLGTGKATTIRELAEMIKNLAGSDAPIVDSPPREGDVLHSLADISRAQDRLNFNPKAKLSVELHELLRAQ